MATFDMLQARVTNGVLNKLSFYEPNYIDCINFLTRFYHEYVRIKAIKNDFIVVDLSSFLEFSLAMWRVYMLYNYRDVYMKMQAPGNVKAMGSDEYAGVAVNNVRAYARLPDYSPSMLKDFYKGEIPVLLLNIIRHMSTPLIYNNEIKVPLPIPVTPVMVGRAVDDTVSGTLCMGDIYLGQIANPRGLPNGLNIPVRLNVRDAIGQMFRGFDLLTIYSYECVALQPFTWTLIRGQTWNTYGRHPMDKGRDIKKKFDVKHLVADAFNDLVEDHPAHTRPRVTRPRTTIFTCSGIWDDNFFSNCLMLPVVKAYRVDETKDDKEFDQAFQRLWVNNRRLPGITMFWRRAEAMFLTDFLCWTEDKLFGRMYQIRNRQLTYLSRLAIEFCTWSIYPPKVFDPGKLEMVKNSLPGPKSKRKKVLPSLKPRKKKQSRKVDQFHDYVAENEEDHKPKHNEGETPSPKKDKI
jgi:hypothetical protein